MFRCEAVSRRYGTETALAEITFEFPLRGIVGIVGPNGSGKTTLLNILTGLDRPSSGRCTFQGRDTTRMGPARLARAGVLRTFQVPRLIEGMTVRDNILTALEGRGSLLGSVLGQGGPSSEIARQIASEIGLSERMDSPVTQLSLGQKRRLTMAYFEGRADITALVADEPFSGLDSDGVRILTSRLSRVAHERGCLVIIVDHREAVLKSIADRILTLG